MNELKYITSTTDKSFNNSVFTITSELLKNVVNNHDFESVTRAFNNDLKKDEVELLTQMYDDRESNPNSKFVLTYLKID